MDDMTQPTPQERWDAAGKAKDGFEAYDLLYSAWPEIPAPRLFALERDTDVSGISGTGRVADGVLWPDGTVTVRWRGQRPSTVNWNSIEDVAAINGHGGATRIVFAAPADPRFRSRTQEPVEVDDETRLAVAFMEFCQAAQRRGDAPPDVHQFTAAWEANGRQWVKRL